MHSAFLLLTQGLAVGLLTLTRVSASGKDLLNYYSFEKYVQDYGKVYDSQHERANRKEIFQENLFTILQHNQENELKTGGYRMGINEWTDRRIPEEIPFGLKKNVPEEIYGLLKSKSTAAEAFYSEWLQTVVPASELPKERDWRAHNPKITTDVKEQGFCGSCWAVATAAVLESHIALRTGKLYTLSPQEMVSCVDNPEHCGGTGGCSGATYELAFEFAAKHGVVTEEDFPYRSGRGGKVECSLTNSTNLPEFLLRGSSAANLGINSENDYIDGAVATIDGYIHFPTNNYTILMNAIATLGPIGVMVAASPWALYTGGVFSSKNHNSSATTDVNHAVVLEGYGIDQETQEPYWLVRNSWGSSWGEDGYMRLLRVDPDTLSDFDKEDCGIDKTTSDGNGCTKDEDGNDIVPPPVKVCGTSTILYGSYVPIGGRLLSSGKSTGIATFL